MINLPRDFTMELNPSSSSAPLLNNNTTSNPNLDSAALLGFPNNSMVNWLQLYHDHLAEGSNATTGAMISSTGAHVRSSVAQTQDSEATSVTTKALPSSNLSVNGATGKVGKKRSRASRRAPTTLLNTDTSNFRAMVQQFTGIPQPPLQTSFFSRSLPHASSSFLPSASLSLPHYYNYRPQQYPSFPFQSALHDGSNGPLLVPTCPSQGHPSGGMGIVDDLGLNSASSSSSLFSSNPSLSWSERRSGYLL